jgi:hypothetical protein
MIRLCPEELPAAAGRVRDLLRLQQPAQTPARDTPRTRALRLSSAVKFWSLLDSSEYLKRLGMMHADIQTRRRTLKLSVHDCSQTIAGHGGAPEA